MPPRDMHDRPLIGAQTLLGKLLRERADLDAAIRVLERYEPKPGRAPATVNGHRSSAPATDLPAGLVPGSQEARVYLALTDTPQTRRPLAEALQLKSGENREDAFNRISNTLNALQKKRLAERTPQGWVRAPHR